VRSHKQIAIHYLSGWFLIDLVSILTCIIDIYPLTTGNSNEGSEPGLADSTNIEQLRVLRVLRVLRLIKLVRLAKSSRILNRWQSSIALDFSTQTIIYCTSSYLLAAHWFSCLLVLITTFAESKYHTWLGAKGFCIRLSDINPDNPTEADLPYGREWKLEPLPYEPHLAHLDDVYCVSAWETWIATYYWMIQLISGAAGGDTDRVYMKANECLVFSILVVISCLLMSRIIAAFCDVLANLNPEQASFRNQMDAVNRYCRHHKLEKGMRRHLREYIMRTKHIQSMNAQNQLMSLMSPKLQGELSLQVNGPWLMALPFLSGVEVACMVRIALALKPLVFVPTELLPSESMYYLAKGTVVHRGGVKTGGSVWGTDCVLNKAALRSRPARALTYAEVSRIHRDELKAIINTSVERVDENGQFIIIFEYPQAVKRLRWETIRTGLSRELKRLAQSGSHGGAWTKAFLAMERNNHGYIEDAMESAFADPSASAGVVRNGVSTLKAKAKSGSALVRSSTLKDVTKNGFGKMTGQQLNQQPSTNPPTDSTTASQPSTERAATMPFPDYHADDSEVTLEMPAPASYYADAARRVVSAAATPDDIESAAQPPEQTRRRRRTKRSGAVTPSPTRSGAPTPALTPSAPRSGSPSVRGSRSGTPRSMSPVDDGAGKPQYGGSWL